MKRDGTGQPLIVLPPINVALYPLLFVSSSFAPGESRDTVPTHRVTGQPPTKLDVPSVDTSLLSISRIQSSWPGKKINSPTSFPSSTVAAQAKPKSISSFLNNVNHVWILLYVLQIILCHCSKIPLVFIAVVAYSCFQFENMWRKVVRVDRVEICIISQC